MNINISKQTSRQLKERFQCQFNKLEQKLRLCKLGKRNQSEDQLKKIKQCKQSQTEVWESSREIKQELSSVKEVTSHATALSNPTTDTEKSVVEIGKCKHGRKCRFVFLGLCNNKHYYKEKQIVKDWERTKSKLQNKVKMMEEMIVVHQNKIKELEIKLEQKKYVYKYDQIPREWITQAMHLNQKFGEFWQRKIKKWLNKEIESMTEFSIGVGKQTVMEAVYNILDEINSEENEQEESNQIMEQEDDGVT